MREPEAFFASALTEKEPAGQKPAEREEELLENGLEEQFRVQPGTI